MRHATHRLPHLVLDCVLTMSPHQRVEFGPPLPPGPVYGFFRPAAVARSAPDDPSPPCPAVLGRPRYSQWTQPALTVGAAGAGHPPPSRGHVHPRQPDGEHGTTVRVAAHVDAPTVQPRSPRRGPDPGRCHRTGTGRCRPCRSARTHVGWRTLAAQDHDHGPQAKARAAGGAGAYICPGFRE